MGKKYKYIQFGDTSRKVNLHCESCNAILDSTYNNCLTEAGDRLREANRKKYFNHNDKWECHDCFSQERFNAAYDNYVDPKCMYRGTE